MNAIASDCQIEEFGTRSIDADNQIEEIGTIVRNSEFTCRVYSGY